jgi:LPS-assembly lipoprotein
VIRRRTLLSLAGSGCAFAAATALGGCGFAPVYARTGSGAPGIASRELSAISVDIIGDRPGQLLRQALQTRFEGDGSGVARRYDLSVDYSIPGEGIAVQPDSSVTYVRLIANAKWTLRAQDPARTVITTGRARAMDAVNVLDNQYFASDLETETVQRRLAEAVADQIALQLASFFRKRTIHAA